MNALPGRSTVDRRPDADTLVQQVWFFKALANPTRAQIVEFLLERERCVCEMTGPLDISQPLVSHHLALLRDAGLVRMRSEGARTYYSLDRERFGAALAEFLGCVESHQTARRNT
jgi:ArsR family transcriptional regulator